MAKESWGHVEGTAITDVLTGLKSDDASISEALYVTSIAMEIEAKKIGTMGYIFSELQDHYEDASFYWNDDGKMSDAVERLTDFWMLADTPYPADAPGASFLTEINCSEDTICQALHYTKTWLDKKSARKAVEDEIYKLRALSLEETQECWVTMKDARMAIAGLKEHWALWAQHIVRSDPQSDAKIPFRIFDTEAMVYLPGAYHTRQEAQEITHSLNSLSGASKAFEDICIRDDVMICSEAVTALEPYL